jgi:aspartate racemase
MGPRSTALFIDQVVTECQRQYGAKDDEEWQAAVDSVIGRVKASEIDFARSIWRELLAQLAAEVDSAILACTELNPANAGVPGELMLLDATECLARATVRTWRELG